MKVKTFNELKKEYDKKYNEELHKTGIFWAFSDQQFNENKTHKNAPDNEYLSVFGGAYIHKSNKEKLDNFFKIIAPNLEKEFINKINIDDLIDYELANHEAYYTGEYYDILYIIKNYYNNYSDDELLEKIKKVYYKNYDKYEYF